MKIKFLTKKTKRKALYKTISWRIVASTTTLLLTWLITGSLAFGVMVGGAEAVAKMFLYYFHELAWDKVKVD